MFSMEAPLHGDLLTVRIDSNQGQLCAVTLP